MGLAVLALTARSGPLARRPVRIGLAVAAGAELVIDKLPITPSRLQARGLLSRLVGGTACGALVGYRGNKSRDAALAAAAGGGERPGLRRRRFPVAALRGWTGRA